MTIYERIKARRDELGLSQQELATKIGYKSRSAIHKIEMGLRDLNQTKINAFAKALNTTPAYLMGWEEIDVTTSSPSLFRIQISPRNTNVPLSESDNAYSFFTDDVKKEPNCENIINTSIDVDADFAIKVLDDNMSGCGIKKSDIAFAKKRSFADNGKIAVIKSDNKYILKRFYYYEESKKLILQTDNPNIEPEIYTDKEINTVKVKGQVVGFASIL